MDRAGICKKTITTAGKKAVHREMQEYEGLVASFSSRELAPLLGLPHVATFYGWQQRGLIPKPRLSARVGTVWANVYTMEEAIEFARILSNHFKTKNYLTEKDSEVISELFEAME